ncbi:MAG: cation:proton antiporter [Candidatus Woesearchaeota archaeon]|jgi:NhaP-type Na+/H+ or K+/H+ antiporter|nr:cation:proton antiporter [Candidatus Woesearchaeota archaeon]
MDLSLLFLTLLTVVFLIGLISSIISNRFKIPNLLLLLLAGMLLGRMRLGGAKLFNFPPEFISVIALLALVLIVFSGAAGFKLKQFDMISSQAIKYSLIWMVLNIAVLSLATYLLFGINHVLILLLFTSLLSGTSPDAVIPMLGKSKSPVVGFLEVESIVNTPLMVLIPFIIMDFLVNAATPEFTVILKLFALKFVAGIGAGILIGIIIFKYMHRYYSVNLSTLGILTAAMMTYILAENLGGNGVLAVTTLGLFSGSIYIKEKEKLFDFSNVLSNILEILVFVLVGLIIVLPLDFLFYLKSSALFAVFLLIRFIAFKITFRNKEYSKKEIVFMTLNASKGVAVAVVVLSISATLLGKIDVTNNILMTVINLSLVFLLYSIIVGTITLKFADKFLGKSALPKTS